MGTEAHLATATLAQLQRLTLLIRQNFQIRGLHKAIRPGPTRKLSRCSPTFEFMQGGTAKAGVENLQGNKGGNGGEEKGGGKPPEQRREGGGKGDDYQMLTFLKRVTFFKTHLLYLLRRHLAMRFGGPPGVGEHKSSPFYCHMAWNTWELSPRDTAWRIGMFRGTFCVREAA